MKKLVPVISTLLVGATMLGACGLTSTTAPKHASVAIVVGVSRNSFALSAKDPALAQLGAELAAENAKVTFISGGAAPQIVGGLTLSSMGPNPLYAKAAAAYSEKVFVRTITHIVPQAGGADPLQAFDLAANTVRGHVGAEVIMIDDGLSTVAPLDMVHANVFGANPADVVSFVTAEHELASAAGEEVTMVNLGVTASPQGSLPEASYKGLVALWQAIFEAAGAKSVTISTQAMVNATPPSSWPSVPVVPVAEPGNYQGPIYRTSGIELPLGAATFGTGSAVLSQHAVTVLNQDLSLIAEYPSAHLLVEGGTDATPDLNPGGNKALGLARASSVKAWLVSHGIQASRIATATLGTADPVASNATAVGRALNRRAEIVIEE